MINYPVVPAGGRKPKSLPAFIVASNGIFLRKESALGVTQTRVSNIAHLPALNPELDYKLPRIPKKLSAQIAGFLLKVDKVHHSEGAVLLCLDKQRKWRIVIPRQDTSGADVKYFVDEDTIPNGWLLAGTVHSHPFNKTSAPTASWTDESDERKIDGVHLVAGSLEHNPKYGAAVVVDGTRFKYSDWQDLMEPAEPVDVPDEWLDKIEKKKSFVSKITTKISGGYSGSSYTSKPYVPDYYPRGDETPEQAIARARKHSIEWIAEDAAKLGYKFTWSLEELPPGQKYEAEDKTITATSTKDTVIIGSKSNPIPIPTTTPPKALDYNELDFGYGSPEEGGLWREATPIKCREKHPGDLCKPGCGCHCEPCRKHIVGAYDGAQLSPPVPEQPSGEIEWLHGSPPEEDECKCTKCFLGCYTYLKSWDEEGVDSDDYDPNLCGFCNRGEHYTQDGSIRKSKKEAKT